MTLKISGGEASVQELYGVYGDSFVAILIRSGSASLDLIYIVAIRYEVFTCMK